MFLGSRTNYQGRNRKFSVTGFVDAQLLGNYVILEVIAKHRAGWGLATPWKPIPVLSRRGHTRGDPLRPETGTCEALVVTVKAKN